MPPTSMLIQSAATPLLGHSTEEPNAPKRDCEVAESLILATCQMESPGPFSVGNRGFLFCWGLVVLLHAVLGALGTICRIDSHRCVLVGGIGGAVTDATVDTSFLGRCM